MRYTAVALVALVSTSALAAQVVADVSPGTTHCGFYLDSAVTPSVVPVDAGGATCTYNASAVSAGTHNIVADARTATVDPVWGSVTATSAKSAPFSFTKPAATMPSGGPAPSNFRLVP